MATDLSNWTKLEEKDVFQKKERRRFGDAADEKYQKININANIKTGDFSVFATGTKLGGLEGYPVGEDIPIYSFDSANNRILITNKNYFAEMFKGSGGRNDIFKKLNKQTKIDILSISKSKSNTSAGQSNYIQLKNTTAYKSASNIINTPPQTVVGQPTNNSTTTKSSKSKSAVRSANNAIRPIDMGDLSFFDFNLNVIVPQDDAVKDTATGAQYFRYPEGRIPQLGYDYIQITSYKHVPGLSLPAAGTGSTSATSYIRTNNKQTTSGRILSQQAENIIQLPMIGGLSETTAVSWNSDTLSEINLIAGNIAYANITGGSNPVTAVTGALMDVIKTGQEGLLDADTKTALMAYFAGQAASAPNFVQRATGKRINNNLELLFNGPTLRSFNFSFKLRPRTESESIVCRNIIKSLKRDSAPKTSTTNLFLETPNVFLLEYIYQAQDGIVPTYTQHPFMNMIKPCALTSINVNYTPDGSYMTYETNGSMVGYDLNLTFQEIEPIYRSDQEAEYKRDNMGY
tara:strand:- start:470 stop:2017 length:1548 start_codon:yes stop_codon:yes gene_type:complete